MFVAGSCRGIPHVAYAAMAEAIALRDGLLLVGQLGCNRIKVNSDCLEVVDTMKNGGNSISVAASVFEE
jgi:TPP-dependent indolepyruvate ferredoxin oxidoreductase alpha subunit